MNNRQKSFSLNRLLLRVVTRTAIPAVMLIYLIFVSPIVDSFKSQDYITKPVVNDFYIININKNLSLFNHNKPVGKTVKYKIFKLISVTKENVILKYNDIGYESRNEAKKAIMRGEVYFPEYYQNNEVVIAIRSLTKLNFSNTIRLIYRDTRNQNNILYQQSLFTCRRDKFTRSPRFVTNTATKNNVSLDYFNKLEHSSISINEYEELGKCYKNRGHYKQALKVYSTAINIYPEKVDLRLNRGHCNFKIKYYKEAIVDFEKVIAISPNDSAIHTILSTLYFMIGDNQSALKHFRKTIQIDPDKEQNSHWILLYAYAAFLGSTKFNEDYFYIDSRKTSIASDNIKSQIDMLEILHNSKERPKYQTSDEISSWIKKYSHLEQPTFFALLSEWAETDAKKELLSKFKYREARN